MSSKEVFPRHKSNVSRSRFIKEKALFITVDQLIGQNQIWESSFSLHDYLDWGFSEGRGSNGKTFIYGVIPI